MSTVFSFYVVHPNWRVCLTRQAARSNDVLVRRWGEYRTALPIHILTYFVLRQSEMLVRPTQNKLDDLNVLSARTLFWLWLLRRSWTTYSALNLSTSRSNLSPTLVISIFSLTLFSWYYLLGYLSPDCVIPFLWLNYLSLTPRLLLLPPTQQLEYSVCGDTSCERSARRRRASAVRWRCRCVVRLQMALLVDCSGAPDSDGKRRQPTDVECRCLLLKLINLDNTGISLDELLLRNLMNNGQICA